ncbi:CopG family ribbon-helix-helix protein [Aurantimonas sp. VKM B-3413]|uniref:CopG family ribbon-helix-helix protein n=1 Tax=Aurantimonas sp. VKM B-3413 TaxID=2779401 RepID=UPI001E627C73|nr:ribbon-helix-helix protein, CopG family [Aurantimonas sp. VKM B-3413]MCB8837605.1 ribbon-helix-helix protein, CopG family [Aurantimonas sp. VKM B-3413]
MTITIDLPPEQLARIDALAARSRRSVAEVVSDALENGHSLEWQEYYLDKVEAGTAAADRGDFATPEDLERVLSKCRLG